MNNTRIFIPKHGKLGQGFSRADIIDSMAHPGRRTSARGYQSPASWITELADGRKAILLCQICDAKFSASKNKYRLNYTPDPTGATSGYVCNGMCDACKEQTVNLGGGKLWIAEEYWAEVSVDPQVARRNARMAWGQPKRWFFDKFRKQRRK